MADTLNLTDSMRAQLAVTVGFPATEIARAVAVSIAEDGSGDPTVEHRNVNGSIDYGLWQINSIHGFPVSQLKEPLGNAQAAKKVWDQAGGSWKPWSTFMSGAYLAFMPRGQAAAKDNGGATTLPAPGAGPNPVDGIVNFFKFISDSHNWIRVAYFVAGLVLLIIGLFKLTGDNKLSPVTKAVAKTAAGAAVAA